MNLDSLFLRIWHDHLFVVSAHHSLPAQDKGVSHGHATSLFGVQQSLSATGSLLQPGLGTE